MKRPFFNRIEAGKFLAERLTVYVDRDDVLVLALPRGGVPVAAEVAKRLKAPLDVFVVRKLGLPGHPELAMGAIATGGVRVTNREVVEAWQIPEIVIDAVAAQEQEELARREHAYRGDLPSPEVEGKTIIVVDDGIATGSTMLAAVAALRAIARGPHHRRGTSDSWIYLLSNPPGSRRCGSRNRAGRILRCRPMVRRFFTNKR